MFYELTQDGNTGNWWIWRCHEDGYREIVQTLSADMTITEAHRWMEAWVEKQNGNI